MVVKYFRQILTVIFILLILAASPFCVAETTVDITIKPSRGSMNTQFLISVEVNNGGLFEKPKIIQSDDFELKYIGPEQQVSVINGQLSSSTKYRYRGTALKNGTLNLPTFSLQTDKDEIRTPQKTIQIDQSAHDTTKTIEGDVKVESSFSKSTVFSGEQVALTTKLSTAVRLENLQFPSASDINFWTEPLSPPQQYREENEQGQTVTVLEQSHSIYPLIKQGKLVIPPQILTAQAAVADPEANSIFDNFGSFGSSIFRGGIFSGMMPFGLQPITLSTKKLELNVIELPKRNAPTGKFEIKYQSVLVGDTDINLSIDNNVITNNEGASLKLVITSLGNINSLRKLSLPYIPNFDLEPIQENIGKSVNNNELRGIYTGLFTLIPKQNGNYDFPPLELTIFNPNTGQYETLQTQNIHIIASGIQPKNLVTTENDASITNNTPRTEKTISNLGATEQDSATKSKTRNFSASKLITYSVVILLITLIVSITYWNYTKSARANFKLPVAAKITSYEDLQLLLDELSTHIGPIKADFPGNQAHYQIALDILTESKYNPTFEFDQKIFNSTRDTILSLCQLKLRQKKKH